MLDVQHCHRLVIYGGTFDPPHRAHIELPLHAANAIGADGVLFIPAGQPPHKPDRASTAAHHRLAMLTAALRNEPRAAINDCEIHRDGPSYTADTLRHLHDALGPDITLRLLIGADMAAIFNQWRDPDVIVDLAEPLVMLRPPATADDLLSAITQDLTEQRVWQGRMVNVPQIDISSTELRDRLALHGADDEQVRQMLHPAVRQYIQAHDLYQRAR